MWTPLPFREGARGWVRPTPPLQMLERGPGGEARLLPPFPFPLGRGLGGRSAPPSCSSPHPANPDADKVPPPKAVVFAPPPVDMSPLTGIGSCKSFLEHRAPPGRDAHEVSSCQPTTVAPPPSRGRRVMTDPAPRHPTWRGMTVRAPPLGHRVLTYPRPARPGRRVSTVCVPPFWHRVMSDPAPPCARRGMAVRVPPRGHRVLTYPRPLRPRRRVSTVCVPPFWHRVMSDPAPPCARRGMAVRVPPRGHRVLTYPRPLRPGRRVSTVCVPRNGRQITSDLAPRQRRRVVKDPSLRHPTWRGMTVRAPPLGHRVPTYPWPARLGRRVGTVCVPWRTPPSPCRPANTGCARRACPASLPIPAPTRTPTRSPPMPT